MRARRCVQTLPPVGASEARECGVCINQPGVREPRSLLRENVRYSVPMPDVEPPSKPSRSQRGADKTARNPVKIIPVEGPLPRKPPWIRVKAPLGPGVGRIKKLLREQQLHTVCEEASCPNLAECFNHGTATFMIMGDLCTRRCPFCDVAHGRPKPLDVEEPGHLAAAVAVMGLKYVAPRCTTLRDRKPTTSPFARWPRRGA